MMKCIKCGKERKYLSENKCILCIKGERDAEEELGEWKEKIVVEKRGLEVESPKRVIF